MITVFLSHSLKDIFKLVEAFLQIRSCFLSHSRYTWLNAISNHCLAALPAKDVYIQQSHAAKRLLWKF